MVDDSLLHGPSAVLPTQAPENTAHAPADDYYMDERHQRFYNVRTGFSVSFTELIFAARRQMNNWPCVEANTQTCAPLDHITWA
jgi:hypothetical protein